MKEGATVSRVLEGVNILPELLDATPNACLFILEDGTIEFASRAFGELFGIEPSAIVGRTLKDIEQEWSGKFADILSYHETVTHPFEDRETRFLRDVEISSPERALCSTSEGRTARSSVRPRTARCRIF